MTEIQTVIDEAHNALAALYKLLPVVARNEQAEKHMAAIERALAALQKIADKEKH